MQCPAVGLGIDRDGGNPHTPRGADDAAGDLAAIGDQNFAEHSGSDQIVFALWLSLTPPRMTGSRIYRA